MKKLFAALAFVLSAGSASALTITEYHRPWDDHYYCSNKCRPGVRFTIDAQDDWRNVHVTYKHTEWTSDLVMVLPEGIRISQRSNSNVRIEEKGEYSSERVLYMHTQGQASMMDHSFTLSSNGSIFDKLGGEWFTHIYYFGNEYYAWGKAVLDGPEDTHVVISHLAPVPLPAAGLMLPLSLGALAMVKRRKKKDV